MLLAVDGRPSLPLDELLALPCPNIGGGSRGERSSGAVCRRFNVTGRGGVFCRRCRDCVLVLTPDGNSLN